MFVINSFINWCKVLLLTAALIFNYCTLSNDNYKNINRTLTNLKLEFPDIFMIGAMKCGTTSLNKLMIQHPQICNKGTKEKHFFDITEVYESKKGLSNYLKEFRSCLPGQKTIDSTPRYIQIDEVPKRIVDSYSTKTLHQKKFILILRDPISRHYSEYQMKIRVCLDYKHSVNDDDLDENDEKRAVQKEERAANHCPHVIPNFQPGVMFSKSKMLTFRDWVKSENGQQEISRGHYKEHITKWIDSGIPRSQIFIINFQSLVENTKNVTDSLALFLGLKTNWGPNVQLPKPKKTKPDTILDCKTFDALDLYYKKVNRNLVYFINNAVDKPSVEPEFPDFVSSRRYCT